VAAIEGEVESIGDALQGVEVGAVAAVLNA
jgi:hypothetical protein